MYINIRLHSIVWMPTGRSARIAGAMDSHLPFILYQAVLFGFDWVIYANISYCRVSVIPDGKN